MPSNVVPLFPIQTNFMPFLVERLDLGLIVFLFGRVVEFGSEIMTMQR